MHHSRNFRPAARRKLIRREKNESQKGGGGNDRKPQNIPLYATQNVLSLFFVYYVCQSQVLHELTTVNTYALG